MSELTIQSYQETLDKVAHFLAGIKVAKGSIDPLEEYHIHRLLSLKKDLSKVKSEEVV